MNIPEMKKEVPSVTFSGLMSERQAELADGYLADPDKAWISDMAATGTAKISAHDPLHSTVSIAGVDIPLGVHPAVGGDGDAPIPGELLSAALASCLDSAIRIIANRLDVILLELAVVVTAEVDVRGTLRLNPQTPVAFQKMHISVRLDAAQGTNPAILNALLQAAETSCVVLQTLRTPPQITTQYDLNCA